VTTACDLYRGRAVLITGGTRGIGLETALVFARHGAQTILTHAWGSADERVLAETVQAAGGPAPIVVQADVARSDDTAALMAAIGGRVARIDAFVSNASAALVVNGQADYSERGFMKSLRASAWATFDYLAAIRSTFGAYPRYVVVMSSDGPDRFTPGYDFVAAAKAAAETLVRYQAYRLRHEGVRVNVLRSRAVRTESFDETFGSAFYTFLRQFVPDAWFMNADEVARAAFALCSGLFDGVTGQTIMVDRGNTFADGISYIYERREALGLGSRT
jgi:NAD(P)-dependent dehydrogenase (short-subunit alcohol dehydrogenase family)